MNTTLLFAEILIIGMQSSLWLLLLALIAFGFNWLPSISKIGLADWQTMFVLFVLSIVYAFGIILDRLADLLFSKWDKKIRQIIMPRSEFPLPSHVMRFDLGKDNEYLNRQFEYTRSRMRISRASVINFALTTLFGSWFIAQNPIIDSINMGKFLAVAIFFGLILTMSGVYTWQKLTRSYYGMTKASWQLYLKTKEEKLNSRSNAMKSKRKISPKSKAG